MFRKSGPSVEATLIRAAFDPDDIDHRGQGRLMKAGHDGYLQPADSSRRLIHLLGVTVANRGRAAITVRGYEATLDYKGKVFRSTEFADLSKTLPFRLDSQDEETWYLPMDETIAWLRMVRRHSDYRPIGLFMTVHLAGGRSVRTPERIQVFQLLAREDQA